MTEARPPADSHPKPVAHGPKARYNAGVDGQQTRLLKQLDNPGYTPGRRDLKALCQLLLTADRATAKRVEKAWLRVDPQVIAAQSSVLIQQLEEAEPRAQARLCRTYGRLANKNPDFAKTLCTPLLAVLGSDDTQAQRHAYAALGKLGEYTPVSQLVAHAQASTAASNLKTFVETLGKCGDQAALVWLEQLAIDKARDPETHRVWQRATLMLRRTLARTPQQAEPPQLDTTVSAALPVILMCRAGLEELVVQSCNTLGLEATTARRGEVLVHVNGRLDRLYGLRNILEFAVELPLAEGDLATAVATSLQAATWLQNPSKPTRVRVCFAHRPGRQRAKLWDLAAVVEAIDGLTNDPSQSEWEVRIDPKRERQLVVPRGFLDPRFGYRKADVPAASHPTIAATLAQLAVEPTATGRVWDPFVGSGLELVEAGLRAKNVQLHGTDLQTNALQAAAQNLQAAGLRSRTTLAQADACEAQPAKVNTIITNPPMGRRVNRGDVGPLLEQFLDNAKRVLPVGGQLWWISPLPVRTHKYAYANKWKVVMTQAIDMGGFEGEIQGLVRQ